MMSLLDGMKDKLGFGNKPEWADDEEYYDDAEYDEGYDEKYDDEEDPDNRHEVISFDSYNPENFEHVTLASDRKPRVASYDSLDVQRSGRGYGGRSTSNSYSRNIGTSAARRDSDRQSGEATWSAPEAPSFLDKPAAARPSRDPYSSLGSDFLQIKGGPASRLEIVCPKIYADIEKVANAAKMGKVVVLSVVETKPALAKRILDFSFGVASALNLNVDKAADRVFVIAKGDGALSDEDRAYLVSKGILK
jgi:FtsZ-interacting cell division protein YlmF